MYFLLEAIPADFSQIINALQAPGNGQISKLTVLNFDLDFKFLKQVLAKIGIENFARAVRYCRLYVGATPNEKSRALAEINL